MIADVISKVETLGSLQKTKQRRASFEQHYTMDFATFKHAWESGNIPQPHSYAVEQDYWEWEATVTDERRLLEMQDRRI